MKNKSYYYIKPKSQPQVYYRQPDTSYTPEPEKESFFTEEVIPKSQVIDMTFAPSHTAVVRHVDHVSVPSVIFKGSMVILLSGLLFLSGFQVSSAADNLKSEVTDLSSRAVGKLEAAAEAMKAQDYVKAKDNFVAAENLFSEAQKELLALGQANLYLSNVGNNNFQIVTGLKVVDAGLNLSQSGNLLLTSMGPTLQYFNGLSGPAVTPEDMPAHVASLLTNSRQDLDRALGKVQKANQLLASIDTNKVAPEYAQSIKNAQEKTVAMQSGVTILGTISRELPSALGFPNPKTYILLNQNNNEIRASGGFIGSIVQVKIYKGKIEKVTVDNTHRIDGQNPKSVVELPAPLRTIAWSGSFGTRDSNWYADYPTSARTFQKLYEEAGGGTADGIIAINPEIIKDILTLTGPIYITDKNVTVDANNFVDLTQEHTQIIDNQKQNPKEILNQLAPLLLNRIMTADSQQLTKMNQAVVKRLQTKDVMIFMRNQKLQGVVSSLNFAGALPAVESDFLGIVHANLGAKKSSGNMAIKVDHKAFISENGTAKTNLNLSYTHQGTHQYPDGTNKDYVRVYTPKGSQLLESKGQDEGTNFDVFDENEKTVFGFWLTTLPGESKQVSLSYKLPLEIKDNYMLYVLKQAGSNNVLFTSSVLKASNLTDSETFVKSRTLFSGKFEGDMILETLISEIK